MDKKYFLYYPNGNLEEFEVEQAVLDRVNHLLEVEEAYLRDVRIVIGREYKIKQTFELGE